MTRPPTLRRPDGGGGGPVGSCDPMGPMRCGELMGSVNPMGGDDSAGCIGRMGCAGPLAPEP